MKRILLTAIAMTLTLQAQAATKVIESITITGGDFSMGAPIPADCTTAGPLDSFQCINAGGGITITRGTITQNFGALFNFFNSPVSGSLAATATGAENARDWTSGFQGTVDDLANTITMNMGGWYALWSGTYFLQGTDSTETVSSAGSPPVDGYSVAAATGTVNLTGNTFDASWFSFITTAPFAGQTGYWRINGTVVYDETAPVITLNDTTNPQTLLLGTPYVEAGATALDNVDGSVSVNISGTVNENITGLYTITYTATDLSSNTATVTRNVNVINGNPPVVTINGSSPVTINEDTIYSDAGATATDVEDGDLTSSIVTTNPVNDTQPGSYTVTYTVTDSQGNVGQATRTVNVLDITPPVITLNGASTIIIGLSDTFSDPGSTVIDNSGESLSANITGSVTNGVGGTYYLTYNAQDSAGNTATPIIRTVIIDGVGPEIVLNGSPSVSINAGDSYVDAGATATDDNDNTLVVAVDCSSVDTSTAGIYSCSFSVTDDYGNTSTATREVLVIDTTITVMPQKPVLAAIQNSNTTNIVLTTGGSVMVATDLTTNQLLTSTFDWSATDDAIVPTAGTTSTTFTFDPSVMTDGLYSIRASINAGTANATTTSMLLRIISTAPVLSGTADTDGDGIIDDVEGYDDSDNDGIPDFADANSLAQNVMAVNGSTMIASQGIFRLGTMAKTLGDLTSGNFSPVITAAQITANGGSNDSSVAESCIGGCFDFEVSNLTPGAVINVVLPIDADTIKNNAVYRKYSAMRGWQDFDTSGNDRIASAGLRNGTCPSASAVNTWIDGLFPGDRCIRLTIQDGGFNDEDGVANGIIVDPSGVAQDKPYVPNEADGCSMTHANTQANHHADWLLIAGFIAMLGWFNITRRKA